jgi:hypothetical protein
LAVITYLNIPVILLYIQYTGIRATICLLTRTRYALTSRTPVDVIVIGNNIISYYCLLLDVQSLIGRCRLVCADLDVVRTDDEFDQSTRTYTTHKSHVPAILTGRNAVRVLCSLLVKLECSSRSSRCSYQSLSNDKSAQLSSIFNCGLRNASKLFRVCSTSKSTRTRPN